MFVCIFTILSHKQSDVTTSMFTFITFTTLSHKQSKVTLCSRTDSNTTPARIGVRDPQASRSKRAPGEGFLSLFLRSAGTGAREGSQRTRGRAPAAKAPAKAPSQAPTNHRQEAGERKFLLATRAFFFVPKEPRRWFYFCDLFS